MDQRLEIFFSLAQKITGDPEAAAIFAAVAAREGGLYGNVGDQGRSFGPLQFYTHGQLPGFARWLNVPVAEASQIARDPNQWDKVIQYAWQGYLGNTIREGRRRGISGPALATYASSQGQRSVKPYISGQRFAQLFGGEYTPPDKGMFEPASFQAPPPAIAFELPPPMNVSSAPPPQIVGGIHELSKLMPTDRTPKAAAERELLLAHLINFIPEATRQAMPQNVRMGGRLYDKGKLFKAVAP